MRRGRGNPGRLRPGEGVGIPDRGETPSLHRCLGYAPQVQGGAAKFVERTKETFQPYEINEYLKNVKRVGAVGHVCTDEEFETLRKAGAVPVPDDPVSVAKDVLLFERAKELLMAE